MSLRDALLAKGLVSKKDVERVNRDLKQQRRSEQGQRQRDHELKKAAEAAEAAEREARLAAAAAARRDAAMAREAHEAVHRVRQIVLANRLGGRGPVPFHHRLPDTSRLGRLMLPELLARDLRAGRAGIAVLRRADGAWDAHVVTRRAMDKLRAMGAEELVHDAAGGAHLDDPSEGLLRRDWESSGRPRRVSPGGGG